MGKLVGIKRQKLKYLLVLLGLLLWLPLLTGKVWLLAQVGNWVTAFPRTGSYYCEEIDARLYRDEDYQWYAVFADGQSAPIRIITWGWTGNFFADEQQDGVVVGVKASGVYFWEQIGDSVYLYFEKCPEDVAQIGNIYRFEQEDPTE